MITCVLGDKKYTVDYITGRAMREMEPAARMYGKLTNAAKSFVKGEEMGDAKDIPVADALDVMIKWFCVLFGNQFTPDDVYDNYPADRIMHDIALALVAVQSQTTEILSEFPTKPAAEEKTRKRA